MSKKIFVDGKDEGYVDDPNFWLNPEHPDSFRIAKLDDYYPDRYFKEDHVSATTVESVCKYVPEYFEKLAKRKLNFIIEFGAGGGWFTKGFRDRGFFIYAIEGSSSGYKKIIKRGVPRQCVRKMDLRVHYFCDRLSEFDIALCTEVAEHIEIPFAGVLVENLVRCSDLVWFSFEGPDKASRPHLHHPNEQPARFWINLFDFHGYGCYMLPDNVFFECQMRGRMIFYKKGEGYHVG